MVDEVYGHAYSKEHAESIVADKKEAMIADIKPYITVRSKVNGLDFYHYLHIQGGYGHGKKSVGGAYNFYVFYLEPDVINHFTQSPEFFCKERSIPCGVGKTIEEAYSDFKTKLSTNPLK